MKTSALANDIFKEMHERVKRSEEVEYLIVDADTFFEIKKHKEFTPEFLNPEKGRGDTFIGLKLAVRYHTEFGWEIR